MAICALNQNVLKSTNCAYTLGSISAIYLANYDEVSGTSVDTASGQSVTGISMTTGATFYKIEPARNSASWTDELVVNDDGSKYRTHTVNFNVVGAYDANMVDVVDALSLGKYVAVLEKNDGGMVMLGRTAGVEASTATVGGSDDNSVVNGIQVTLTANMAEAALPVTGDAVNVVKNA